MMACNLCGNTSLKFKDRLSKKEYMISGMCQDCQDKTFVEQKESEVKR